jgi:hypothetical protein
MSAGTFGGGWKVVYRRTRLPSTIVLVDVEDVVVVGVVVGVAVVVVVDVVGVLPLGPDGVFVSQPAITAHSRTPGSHNLRMVPVPRKSNRYQLPE